MHNRKTYFVLPTSDYSYTHITLGSIITDMRLPYRALILHFPPFPKPILRGSRTTLSGSLGVQAQFLAQLGSPLGADINVTGETANASTWVIERLETEFIEPEHQYVEDSVLKVLAVKSYLDARKLGGAVYMVTGIKIARGVSYASRAKERMGLRTGVTIDATALAGAPVSAGPKGEVDRKLDTQESFTGCSDFVFAYRVQKLSIGWLWGRVKSKEKVGGDLAGVGEDTDDDDDDSDEEELENEGFEPQDIDRVALERDDIEIPAGFDKAGEDEDEDLLYEQGRV